MRLEGLCSEQGVQDWQEAPGNPSGREIHAERPALFGEGQPEAQQAIDDTSQAFTFQTASLLLVLLLRAQKESCPAPSQAASK